MDWQASEQKTRRAVRYLPYARVYRRVYAIAPEAIASTIPARGDSVTVIGITATVHTHDLLDLRVLDLGYVSSQKAPILTWIDFIQPLPIGAESGTHYQELLGSRQTSEDRGWQVGVRIGISDTLADVPAEGDAWPSESGLTARHCARIETMMPLQQGNPVPGLYYQRAIYQGMKAYSGS